MPVIYEVNLSIHPDVVNDYLAWLKPHMEEMKGFAGFQAARLYKDEDFASNEPGEDSWIGYVASYDVDTMENLQLYFDEGSKRMRGDGVQRFTGRFRAWRRVLHLQED
ncbi:hypothetical protein TrRE_jg2341 [Triparma retinervis]|uniref:DUF4286 family protein n=1 Tax=Triparma retinervis TaxID=2557542 RepID=A0A9W7AE64_9STRA|nr:hypothetical protein TrRE_jg2341 [Triparma retinervis]